MKDNGPAETSGCENHSFGEWVVAGGSVSTSFMSRNQDISFGTGSPITCDAESPTFTCRSSFSSFLTEPSTPCQASGRFAFCSHGDSNALEFSSPVPSMPSFAFFSPASVIEQGSCALEFSTSKQRVDVVQGGTRVLHLPISTKSFNTFILRFCLCHIVQGQGWGSCSCCRILPFALGMRQKK